MLSLLRIRNFALIDQLELGFGPGLNVLTGETGAGKSIILDAIDCLLGGKVNGRVVRQGCLTAQIEGTFQINAALEAWLTTQQLESLEPHTLVCSRDLLLGSESLRSRSRVNGVIVNRQLLAELRSKLVEITAQGQTVQLMESTVQRNLLDLYGGRPQLEQRQRVEEAYRHYQTAYQALQERRQSEKERLQRLDMLEYQLKELREAQLGEEDEQEQLEQERDRLSHVVELQQLSYQGYQLLYQNDRGEKAVTDLLAEAEHLLSDMSQFDGELETYLEMLRNASAQVIDVGKYLNLYGDRLEADPQRLSEVEERLALLKRITRKYGPSLAEAIAYQEKLEGEAQQINHPEQSLEALEKTLNQAQQTLENHCATLTQLRHQTAQTLEKQLVQELKPLAMEKVIFSCEMSPISPTATGADQVTFYFSPNPGEKIQPLAQTASGGEMSRFLLALKACFSHMESVSQTLIFDEIDVGVSGKVAQAIADKLYQLSQRQQVLCVTHQPLVAALADHHFRVDKTVIAETSLETPSTSPESASSEVRTVVRLSELDTPQRRQEELAQLAGGHSAKEALEFARSLLKKAANYRQRQINKAH